MGPFSVSIFHFFIIQIMLATNDNSVEIGCSQSSTSFADIIINNDNAVADGLISGFAQFVHDPKYLKEFVSVFNRQMIPEKFADAVINRRIDTQELNNIWDFPLNLTCPATVPVPWTIVDATVKAKTAAVQWEFNLMRIVDFIGRNYCRIVLPEVDTTGIMDEAVRKIPIQYTSSGVRQGKSVNYLPLKINSASVMQVIFASSVITGKSPT